MFAEEYKTSSHAVKIGEDKITRTLNQRNVNLFESEIKEIK